MQINIWVWAWSLSLAGVGWSGLDVEAEWFGDSWGARTPSLSPYSDWDLKKTIQFTKKPGTLWIQKPAKTLKVTAYTDRPKMWTSLRYRSAMKLAQWYLARQPGLPAQLCHASEAVHPHLRSCRSPLILLRCSRLAEYAIRTLGGEIYIKSGEEGGVAASFTHPYNKED